MFLRKILHPSISTPYPSHPNASYCHRLRLQRDREAAPFHPLVLRLVERLRLPIKLIIYLTSTRLLHELSPRVYPPQFLLRLLRLLMVVM